MIDKRSGQLWMFVFLTAGFGLLSYLVGGDHAVRSVAVGLVFASLVSAFMAFRHRRP